MGNAHGGRNSAHFSFSHIPEPAAEKELLWARARLLLLAAAVQCRSLKEAQRRKALY